MIGIHSGALEGVVDLSTDGSVSGGKEVTAAFQICFSLLCHAIETVAEDVKEEVAMRRVATLASIGAIVALLATPARAEVVDNESIDISLEVFVPCANGGAGELVDLTGPLHILISFNINGNHVNGTTHFQPQGLSGVGLDTGATYHGVGVTQDHFSGSFNNGQFSETFVNNFRIIGQGSGNNFSIHENTHLTINANGEVTTTHDNFSAVCN